MARGSYQAEVPASRVNIKYVQEIGDSQREAELPLKLLVLGDFSQRENDAPIEDRKAIRVDKNNFAAVMREHRLRLDFMLENKLGEGGEDLRVNLNIDSLDDFTPENIALQVPELRTLLEVRNLLTDLKGRVVNNAQFRRQLELILQDPTRISTLKSYLDQVAPLPEE